MRLGIASMIAVGGILLAAACAAPYSEDAQSQQASTAAANNNNKKKTSSDDTVPGASAAAPAMPMPTPSTTPVPGGGKTASGDGGTDAMAADPTHCPGKTPMTIATWKAPGTVATSCSSADITYFASVAASQTWLGIQSLMTTRNAACSKCIFSQDTDATWRAVVFSGTQGDAIVNYAGCFAHAQGGSDACGRAVYQWSDCYAQVCDGTACGSDAAVTACYNTQATADACAAYAPMTACGGANAYNALNNVCGTYIDVARVVCVK